MPYAAVNFHVISGTVTFGCAASCTLTADSTGLAQTTVTGGAAGILQLSAIEITGGAFVQVSITDTPLSAPLPSPTQLNMSPRARP